MIVNELPGYDCHVEIHYIAYQDGIWKNVEYRIIDEQWRWEVKSEWYKEDGRLLDTHGEADTAEEAAECIEAAIEGWKNRA